MTAKKDADKEKDTPQDADGEQVTMGNATGEVEDDGVLRGLDTTHALATRDSKKGDGDS